MFIYKVATKLRACKTGNCHVKNKKQKRVKVT